MKARRLLPLLLAIALLLVACGGPAPTTAPTSGTGATQPTAAPVATAPVAPTAAEATVAPTTEAAATAEATAAVEPSPVPTATPAISTVGTGSKKITWWHIQTQEDGRNNWQNLANAYVKDHPDVSIEITVLENEAFKSKLTTVMQSGSPPDLFQSWGGGVLRQFAEAGLVQDITPVLKENGWGDTFMPAPLSLFTVDGKTYGAPWDAGMVGFWYNKDLFKKAGIEKAPATWAELLDAVKKLKAAGITPIALGEKDKWPGHFYWVYLATRMGGKDAFEKAYNREGTFADQPFIDAGAKLKELIDLQPFQAGFLGAGYGDQQVQIGNSKAAMELMGQWAYNSDRNVAEDKDAFDKFMGFFPFPAVDGMVGDPSDVLGGGNGFAVGKNAPKEALDFLRYLTSVENQKAMTKVNLIMPVVKGAEVAIDNPLLKEVQQRTGAAKYYQLYYDQYLPPAVGGTVNDSVQGLFAGTMSPEQVAKSIEETASTELAK